MSYGDFDFDEEYAPCSLRFPGHGRDRHSGCEQGLAQVPLCCLLVGVGKGEDSSFRKARTGDHQTDGQTGLRESTWNCDGRNTEDIEGAAVTVDLGLSRLRIFFTAQRFSVR